jgi:hypothetical protein
VVPLLPPGQYQIGVNKLGFKPLTRTGIVLETGITSTVDLQLEVGGVNVKPFDKFEKWTWQDTLILLVHKEKAFLDQWERDLKSGRSRTGNLQIIGQRREAISRFEQQIKEAPCTPGA